MNPLDKKALWCLSSEPIRLDVSFQNVCTFFLS
jgi:hypothetical protein